MIGIYSLCILCREKSSSRAGSYPTTAVSARVAPPSRATASLHLASTLRREQRGVTLTLFLSTHHLYVWMNKNRLTQTHTECIRRRHTAVGTHTLYQGHACTMHIAHAHAHAHMHCSSSATSYTSITTSHNLPLIREIRMGYIGVDTAC